MKKSGTTITEVARVAGVSVSTVSRTINGTAFVAEDKRQAVNRALQELGFQPNYLAKSLITGRSMTVGVIAEDIVSPYYADVIRGFEHGLFDTPYQPVLQSGHWSQQRESGAIETLIYRKVDALVLLGSTLPGEELLDIAGRVPLVVFGRHVPELDARCLTLDQYQGAYLATRHLIELGHRDIAHLRGPDGQQDAEERLRGYQAALRDNDLPSPPELVVQGDFLEQAAYQGTLRLLGNGCPFTAIFAANDQMAVGARLALYRQGLRVPDDVSLVGFDDLPGSAFTTPPLTTVHQPTYQIGRALAAHTLGLLQGETPTLPDFPLTLSIRESTRSLRRTAARRPAL
ncbi:substrate-binding domain-containing protein [uncultured Deinococcus sp.]|uniref:LacI family DNA-binding transcriptional regulator n=1 Tax=uncultured Deinococcus sp. TaxID=158789 RepID=UPI0025851EFD|nr:substrate-binding domain-containing protein [uncultured Deinococcus sp.]